MCVVPIKTENVIPKKRTPVSLSDRDGARLGVLLLLLLLLH
jgi:hypothetical protein